MAGLKFRMKQKEKLELPTQFINKKDLERIGDLVAAGVVRNVEMQRQADGSKLKVNAASTRERKRKLGRKPLSLIDEKHRFIQKGRRSFDRKVQVRGKNKAVLTIFPRTAELKKLSEYVQRKGYTGWFGIHRSTMNAIKKDFSERIKEIVKQAKTR